MPELGFNRLVGTALRCYPAGWRARHGEEARELAALLAGDGIGPWAIAWSYFRGATRERLGAGRGRRFRAAAASLVAVALFVASSPALLFSPAPAGAEGVVRAYITNPSDAARQLEAVFREHHFDVTVTQEPVSPSLVGSVLEVRLAGHTGDHGALGVLLGPCVGGAQNCTRGIVLPLHFAGKARLVVGRPARPAETYEASADIFRPGELLHCSQLLGQTVGEALPALGHLHVRALWEFGGRKTDDGPAPSSSYYVVGGEALSSSIISLRAARTIGQHSLEAHVRHC
jgi:hypothetical protein